MRGHRAKISLLLFLTAGCSTYENLPVKGRLSFYNVETSVDSKIAHFYLSRYLAGKEQDSPLSLFVAEIERKYQKAELTRETLQKLSEDTSVDFAALYFATRLLRRDHNAQVQKQFIQFLKQPETIPDGKSLQNYIVILVPGLDYIEGGPATGADLKAPGRILQKHGLRTKFVPLNPMGSVEDNAAMIKKIVKSYQGNNRIVLAGPSSAGPAIHLCLGSLMTGSSTKNVVAWVNLGGILNGTPLVDWLDSGFTIPLFAAVRWYNGWDMKTFESMKASVRRKIYPKLQLPEHIFILNYLGLSLSGDISEFARDKYNILRQYGPNDALTLLADSLAPGSSTVIAVASDHFFANDPLIDRKTLALLGIVLRQTERTPQ